jgi:hypothetical protein
VRAVELKGDADNMSMLPALFGAITIRPYGKDRWQASVPILDASLVSTLGVLGSVTEQPWIGANGTTPDAALEALYRRVGVFVLQAATREEA